MYQNFNNQCGQNPPICQPASYQGMQNPINGGANAVSINIIQPQAYASAPNTQTTPGFYSMYQPNTNPNMPLYPMNYNNMIGQNPYDNARNAFNDTNLKEKTPNPTEDKDEKKTDKKKDKQKSITFLTDDYIKSLENYFNNDNPEIRLIAAKQLLERFKEDENRYDNPSLTALLNKALRDTSASVRFLALDALHLGYCGGNDETVSILKEIQQSNTDKLGQDYLLASEILLSMTAPQKKEIKE